MKKQQAIKTAKTLREQLGGTIFAFPIEPDNGRNVDDIMSPTLSLRFLLNRTTHFPHTPYAVVVYAGRVFCFPL